MGEETLFVGGAVVVDICVCSSASVVDVGVTSKDVVGKGWKVNDVEEDKIFVVNCGRFVVNNFVLLTV